VDYEGKSAREEDAKMNRSLGAIAFRIVGGIVVVAASFFITLFVIDRFDWFAPGSVMVQEASYGANCKAPAGNLTAYVAKACEQKQRCSLPIDVNKMGDPAPGCGKGFSVKFRCWQNAALRNLSVPPEASGKTLDLDCEKG
jgi:hypothetical protein